ncbi:DegV family protein [Rubneribacter badeniensis]|uniref:DegV family protein n=1 Tax=Rubneribacter badeniensis TaxID=2070688 RepID=A0A2K2U3H0_9ACTN|nr:DegV family protein [Rubneribacter badeniensis]PNV64814.1 DegV family protein [Rubneribacter badeniensis]
MVRIITDSVASIPADEARKAGIEVVTLYVNRDGEELADAEMDLDAFYAEIYDMVDDIPTSSQPSQHALEEAFEDAARAGDEVLGVFISSGLSGTFDGAVRAARAVKARNIDFSYAIVDSSSCGYDEAWPVFDAVEARDAGEGLSGCLSAVLEGMERTRFLFTPETLTFLQKGGRIGGAAALLGNLIQLSPVLTVTDGAAATLAKVRTRKKALERIAATFRADIEKLGLKRVAVHYIGDKAPALAWAREVVEPLIGRTVKVLPVSPVIGLHVGPAVGIAYECASAVASKLTAPARLRVCAS